MAHHKKHGNHVPPDNQPRIGPTTDDAAGQTIPGGQTGNGAYQEQDPKRRFGDYTGAGEHPYQQPGGKNDADH